MTNNKEPSPAEKTFKHAQDIVEKAKRFNNVPKPARPMQNKPTSKPRGRG